MIPTVDRLVYLNQAIRSVVGQDFRDWELLVGENSASLDYGSAVREVVREQTRDISNCVRVIHQPKKLSLTRHGNSLLAEARGLYVMYVPDDDRMLPTCLSVLTAPVLADPGIDLVFSDHWVIGPDGTPDLELTDELSIRYGRRELVGGIIADRALPLLALNQSFMMQAMLVRKSALGTTLFREGLERVPDLDLQLRLGYRIPALRVHYCSERLVEYRIHERQLSAGEAGVEDRLVGHAETLRSLKTFCGADGRCRRLYRRKVAEQYVGLATCYLTGRQWARFLRASIDAMMADPLWSKCYLSMLRIVIPQRAQARLAFLKLR